MIRYYWRAYPRAKPRWKNQYWVTLDVPFDDGPSLDFDAWDGMSWEHFENTVIAWMPMPQPYQPAPKTKKQPQNKE